MTKKEELEAFTILANLAKLYESIAPSTATRLGNDFPKKKYNLITKNNRKDAKDE